MSADLLPDVLCLPSGNLSMTCRVPPSLYTAWGVIRSLPGIFVGAADKRFDASRKSGVEYSRHPKARPIASGQSWQRFWKVGTALHCAHCLLESLIMHVLPILQGFKWCPSQRCIVGQDTSVKGSQAFHHHRRGSSRLVGQAHSTKDCSLLYLLERRSASGIVRAALQSFRSTSTSSPGPKRESRSTSISSPGQKKESP